jgi:type IV secretion system protein VirB6
MTAIFTLINTQINTLSQTFTSEVMENIATNITPVVIAGLTLWIVVFGLLIVNQTIQQSMQSFVMECLKIGVITGIALTGGIYQTTIASAIIELPEDFAKIAFKNPVDTYAMADHIFTIGIDKGMEIIKSASFFTAPFDCIVKMVTGFGIIFSSLLLSCICGLILIIVKAEITIFASLGPLVIVALLFPIIKSWFSNWLSEIMSLCILSLVLAVNSIFILNLAESFVVAIVEGENMILAALAYNVIVFLACLMFFSAKRFSSRIAGVMGGSMASKAVDMGKQAVMSSVGGTPKSAAASTQTQSNAGGSQSQNWRKKK